MSRARLALIAVLLLIAAAAIVLTRESTLVWLAHTLEERSNGDLLLEQPSGTLLTRIHLKRLQWTGDRLDVAADDVNLAWAPWWLLAGKLAFRHADAATLAIVRKPAKASGDALDERLHVPFRLRFDDVQTPALSYAPAPGDVHRFGHASFDLDFGSRAWSFALRRLDTTLGSLSGQGSIGTADPFPTRADLTLVHDTGDGQHSLRAQAKFAGELRLLDIDARITGARSSATAALQVAPMATQPVRRIDAKLDTLDPSELAGQLPLAAIGGTLKADTGTDGVLRGRIDLANREPGTIDAHRLPVTQLSAELATPPDRWELSQLVAQLGDSGRVQGDAWVEARGAGANLTGEGIDLNGLHAALRPTRLAATLHTEGPVDAQHIRLAAKDATLQVAVDAIAGHQRVEVKQARASAAGGTASVNGVIALDGERTFALKGTLARFDPSAFGKYPKAKLNATLAAQGALAPVLQVHGSGKLAHSTLFGLPASGHGTVSSRGRDTPAIALDVAAALGATRIEARGTLKDPANLQALDLDLALAGQNMADLWPITGLPYPDTGPYRVSGRLGYAERVWSFRRFRGEVGKSDLEGDFVVDLKQERPKMTADLTSRRLDITDLGGFVGAGAPHRRDPNRLLSNTAFDLHHLNAAEADIRFSGRSVRNERLPLRAMNARFVLDHGRITVQPLQFKAAGGDLDARITLDARKAPIRGVADIQARGMHLNQLAPGVKALLTSAGTIDGRTRLELRGNSVAEMLASADGDLVLAMNGGSISDVALRLANLDVANTLVAMAKGNPSIPVNCLIADFQARDGVFEPRTLVLDSEHTIVHGDGAIDMHGERLALKLKADPKDGSVLALRGPIRIEGVLAKPVVHPDLSSTVARTGAAVLLAAIAPPLAIVPFLEGGKRESIDCHPLIVEASRFLRTGERKADAIAAAAPAPPHQAVRSRKTVAPAPQGVPLAQNP